MIFRPMRLKDWPRVRQLISQVGTADFSDIPWKRFVQLFNVETVHPYVLDNDEGLIVGTATLNCLVNFKFGWRGYIDYFVIDESYRDQGCGHELLENLIAEAKRLKCHDLLLTTHNKVARKLYEAHGFEERAESKPMILVL